jgi:hypothetical protein
MDPVSNPFAPGAGARPPELAGRDPIIENALIALKRVALGRHAKSQMLLGLRGVGKTVLLNRLAEMAEAERYHTITIEAADSKRLAELLAPQLRVLLFRLSGIEKARVVANRAMATLRSFASVFKISYGDLDVGVEAAPDDVASGDLEADLPLLFISVAQAAQVAERPIGIFIDEVQYLPQADLSALIGSLHKVSQKALPLIVFGAGLPQLAGLAGDAKSYAERLFEFPPIGALGEPESKQALREPIHEAGAEITDEALNDIYRQTSGYPYFLQEWGHHSWNLAVRSPIQLADVTRATEHARETLDSSFFRVRFDRLTAREQDYLRAMAEMGGGPHGSGEIAAKLHVDVTTAGSIRTGLVRKGMIYSPAHGLAAFTVPMFDDFMRREIPNWIAPEKRRKKK